MSEELAIIYANRDRDLKRIAASLESLDVQKQKKFRVHFVDYGSDLKTLDQLKVLCARYSFVQFYTLLTHNQPWNKSKALNTIIKNLKGGFCFIADVDIIFHPKFTTVIAELSHPERAVYFKIGYLSQNESLSSKSFTGFKYSRLSTSEATGLTLFPIGLIQQIRGYDEFYHFWGAEDTDIHVRLRNSGVDISFYEQEVLLLHQWHPSYLSKETNKLTQELQISGIIQINHQHLMQAVEQKKILVNRDQWGECSSESEMRSLESAETNYLLTTEKRIINEFLYCQLPESKDRIIKVKIKEEPFKNSLKYRLKKGLGRKVPQYFSLKEVNDKVLLHLISFYRNNPYYYKVHPDLDQLELAIKL